MAKSKVSNYWYIVPILFGWIGGVIGFFAVRGRDEKKGRNLFLVGLATSIGVFVIGLSVSGQLDLGTIISSPLSLLT